MEILFIAIIMLIISIKKTSNSLTGVEIEKLPTKLNPKGFYEDKAFTEVYHKLKSTNNQE